MATNRSEPSHKQTSHYCHKGHFDGSERINISRALVENTIVEPRSTKLEIMKKKRQFLVVPAVVTAATTLLAPAQILTTSATFQEGTDSYAGTVERRLGVAFEDADGWTIDTTFSSFFLDGGPNAGDRKDCLIRFDNALDSIPDGATVLKAELVLRTGSVSDASPSGGAYNVYRLTAPFDGTTSFAGYSLDGGIQLGQTADWPLGSFEGMTTVDSVGVANVTRAVQDWLNGGDNLGVGIKSERTGDGWAFHTSGSSDLTTRPLLAIDYTTDAVLLSEYQQGLGGYAATVDALINSLEPDTVQLVASESFLDGSDGGSSPDLPYLLKFGNLETDLAGRAINAATLTLVTGYASGAADAGNDEYTVHQLLVPFDATSVYNDFSGDASAMMTAGEIGPAVATLSGLDDTEIITFDLQPVVQSWANGDPNHGIYIANRTGGNGWQIFTSQATDQNFAPYLRVVSSAGNPPPTVSLTGPEDETVYLDGQSFTVSATADDNGTISKVEFFDGDTLLSEVTSEPYEFVWVNPPIGKHRVFVRATDNLGASSDSDPINLFVVYDSVTAPSFAGTSAALIDGKDEDRDFSPPADPANWTVLASSPSPHDISDPGNELGKIDLRVNNLPVSTDAGIVMVANRLDLDTFASFDNIANPFDSSGNYRISVDDNQNNLNSDPLLAEEGGGIAIGLFPFSDGWIGANIDDSGSLIGANGNLPAGVGITRTDTGRYEINGLPTTGNLIACGFGDRNDNVMAVSHVGAPWEIHSRDNSESLEDSSFSFLYIPNNSPQVLSGRIADDGSLTALNETMASVGATVAVQTYGFEITFGDGSVYNPETAALFLTADIDAGAGGDDIYSYSQIGQSFVVSSRDLPTLGRAAQNSAFRFLVVPFGDAAPPADSVTIIATDAQASEHGADTALEFTLTRSGDTSNALSVNYTVGGSAENGVDYSPLTGIVSFEAGSATAQVSVTVTDDDLQEVTETVTLTVAPGLGYTVGSPITASGEISDQALAFTTTSISFQEGVDGYFGTFEKRIGDDGTNEFGNSASAYFLDGSPDSSSSPDINELIHFSGIFGDGNGQIPTGARIINAQLVITTGTGGNAQSGGPWSVNRLTLPVDDVTTYESIDGDLGNGGGEAYLEGARGAATALPVSAYGSIEAGEVVSANVTQFVQEWSDGAANHGLTIYSSGTTDGWQICTTGNPDPAKRPKLIVTYTTEGTNTYTFHVNQSSLLFNLPILLAQDATFLENVFLDANDDNEGTKELLLRFGINFGEGAGEIGDDEKILAAYLQITTNGPFYGGSGNAQSGGPYSVHRMLSEWEASPDNDAFDPYGPTVIGGQAAPAIAELVGMDQGSVSQIDVTSAVIDWKNGQPNHGFDLKPLTTDGWQVFLPGTIYNGTDLPDLRPKLVVITSGSGFSGWATRNGIPGATENNDDDGDEIPAIVEYALGLNPQVFDILPGLSPDGDDFTLTFHKGPEAAADEAISYRVETSTDLVEWTAVDPAINNTATISAAFTTTQPDGKLFVRLVVVHNP